jgi:hypothetical protein
MPKNFDSWVDRNSESCIYTPAQLKKFSLPHLQSGAWYLECGGQFIPAEEDSLFTSINNASSEEDVARVLLDDSDEDVQAAASKDVLLTTKEAKKAQRVALKEARRAEKVIAKESAKVERATKKASKSVPSDTQNFPTSTCTSSPKSPPYIEKLPRDQDHSTLASHIINATQKSILVGKAQMKESKEDDDIEVLILNDSITKLNVELLHDGSKRPEHKLAFDFISKVSIHLCLGNVLAFC